MPHSKMRRIKVNCLEISGTHTTHIHTHAQHLRTNSNSNTNTSTAHRHTDTNRQTDRPRDRQKESQSADNEWLSVADCSCFYCCCFCHGCLSPAYCDNGIQMCTLRSLPWLGLCRGRRLVVICAYRVAEGVKNCRIKMLKCRKMLTKKKKPKQKQLPKTIKVNGREKLQGMACGISAALH